MTQSANTSLTRSTISDQMPPSEIFEGPPFDPPNKISVPNARGLPPTSSDNSSTSGSTVLIAVLVPVCCILLALLLVTVFYKTWTFYHRPPKKQRNNHIEATEGVYEEQEPLRTDLIVADYRASEMQIVPETELKNKSEILKHNSTEKVHNEVETDKEEVIEPVSNKTHTVQFSGVETNHMDCDAKHCVTVEEICERPSTLKFLAASVAFQASTVPALKRLPYTPDPDYVLCENNVVTPVPVDVESQDKVAPLSRSIRTRMKPRGLLERRGSNVALTISLRPGEKGDVGSALGSTKSPKPLAYLQRASLPLSPSELHLKSVDTLKLQQEFWEIPMNHPSEKHFNVAGYGTKNRYRTILPNEHSRVKLPITPREDPLSTYINANYIRDCTDLPSPDPASEVDLVSSPVTRENAAFIATQGPMANTVGDFWRMIWQENSASVIMITKLKERKEKCTQYLPIEIDEKVTYDDVTVQVESLRKHEHFSVRTLRINHGSETRTIKHFWYTTWMDHETPEKTRGLLELVQEVSLWNKPSHGPMVIHCSAGIGRTGCYIAVTVGCQQLMKTGKADILRIVSQMRLDRGGMIQTWEQYQFVHQALSRYGRILAGENVTTPSTTGSIRSPQNLKSSSTREPLTIELPRPGTPKQRRSLSETNLPSPKELKLILMSTPTQMCNIPQSATNGQEKSQIKRKTKPTLTKLSDLPATPPSTPLISPHVARSLSSPAIRSPFDRMCLQSKGSSLTSPLTNNKFEWPENNSAQEGRNCDKDVSSKADSESQSKEKQSRTSNILSNNSKKTSKTSIVNGSCEKGQFSFDFSDAKNVAKLSNGDHDAVKSLSEERLTSNSAAAKSMTPGTAPKFSHFVFPAAPDKR